MAGRAVPRGAVPQARRLARERGGLHRRGSPVRQRVHGVGDPDPDLTTAADVPDPDRGTGADVRAAVRGGAGPARVRGVPGRSGPVELAAGAAGPAGTLVPLPLPVPRHAPGAAGTPESRPDPGAAAPRRRLVRAQWHG